MEAKKPHPNIKIYLEIVLGSIRYRVEIRFVEAHSKYASNNNGSITTQLNYNVVHVAVERMQGKQIDANWHTLQLIQFKLHL